jgi:GPH family glycoside/pentoside/hexuronide:cation symporter
MIPVPFSSKLAKKYGKKNVLGFSLIISSVFYLAMFFIDLSNPAVYLGIFFLAQLSAGFGALLTYAMVADTIDYSEWKTQKRQDGVLYASYSFFRKIGQALAGWLAAMTLTWIGYKANSIQTEFTLSALRNLIVLLPGIFSLVNGLIVLIAYNLGKEKMTNVQQELELRRQN